MNFKYISLLITVFVLAVFVFPSLVFAAEGSIEVTPSPSGSSGVVLQNPLGLGEESKDPRNIVGNVISALLGIVGSITLAVFIFGGFLWVTSAGNEEKIKRGKDIIVWASFGLAVIFASYALVSFVIGALTGSG